MAQKIERFVWIKISLDLGKNGCYRPCGLGGRSIVVVRQEGRSNSSSLGTFKTFNTFNSKIKAAQMD